MLSRRTLLAASAVSATALLLSGCAQPVDASNALLQKRFGIEKGVESVDMSTDLPQETIYFKNWSAKVVFSESASTERVGVLIGMFFSYAKDAGLSVSNMTAVSFRTHQGGDLEVRGVWLDKAQSVQVATAMAALPQSRLSAEVSYGGPAHLDAGWTVSRGSAKDLMGSAALLHSAPVVDGFSVSYTISDYGTPHPYTVSSTHPLSDAEFGFAAACNQWVLTHATTGFILPFSPDVKAHLLIYTDTDVSSDVRALAAVGRAAGVTSTVQAYLTGNTSSYVTIN